jgi:hypothetical protein
MSEKGKFKLTIVTLQIIQTGLVLNDNNALLVLRLYSDLRRGDRGRNSVYDDRVNPHSLYMFPHSQVYTPFAVPVRWERR